MLLGVLIRALFGVLFGMLFGVLFELLVMMRHVFARLTAQEGGMQVTVRAHFCKIGGQSGVLAQVLFWDAGCVRGAGDGPSAFLRD